MICETFNKMGQFIIFVFGGKWTYETQVELSEFVLMIFCFLTTLFVISWWLIPLRSVFNKYGNITFYCKKGE